MEHGKIILYTTGCPKCRILRQKLDNANIGFVMCTNVYEKQAMGFTTVPMLKVGDEIMNFGEAVKWVNSIE